MQFDGTKQRYRSARTKTYVGSVEYSNSLQLYAIPPTETISLQEFEELAIDRLKGTLSR